MNKKLKRKWCAALRGGTYTQTRTSRAGCCSADHMGCALDVLADIQPGLYITHTQFPGHWLAYRAIAALGIPAEVVYTMNDLEGKSFAEIADWIEENL